MIYQGICREFGYSLHSCLDLTIADIITLCAKLSPSESEPEWFIREVKRSKRLKDRLIALAKLMGD